MKNTTFFLFLKLSSFKEFSNFYVVVNKKIEFIFLFYSLKFILTNTFETDQIAISCYHQSEWHRHPKVALKTPAILI